MFDEWLPDEWILPIFTRIETREDDEDKTKERSTGTILSGIQVFGIQMVTVKVLAGAE